MQILEKDLESWSEKIENKEKLLKDDDTKELLINEALSQKAKEAGNDYLRAKDYDQALESYTKAIELNPRNAQAYFNRALVLLKQFKFRKAAEDCDKALLIEPKYAKVHHRRAIALMELKEYDKALEDWKKVLETDPENEEANEKLKKCRDELASITGYRRIQITEVDDDEEEDEGETEGTKDQLNVAGSSQPVDSEELLNIDQSPDITSEILKDPALQAIIALQSQDEFIKELELLKTEGNASFRREDYDQAIQLFTRSIYAIENRFSQEKILENPPVLTLTVAFYNNRALAHSKLDLNLEAINDSKKVLQLDSSNSKALFRIGKCQAVRNNLQAAKEAFNQLLAAEPNNEVAKKELLEVEAKLSSLGAQSSVISPKHRSSFRKHEPQEVDKSFERRVSFRDEDVSLIEHKDSLKSKDKFKKAEAAFPTKIMSDDEEDSQEGEDKEKLEVKEERKARPDKGISKETIQNATDIASKLVVLEAPKTALMFESAAKSLKSDRKSFYEYIHVIYN